MSQRRPIFKIAWTRPICTHCLFVVLQLNICNKHNLFSFLSDILIFFYKDLVPGFHLYHNKEEVGFFSFETKENTCNQFPECDKYHLLLSLYSEKMQQQQPFNSMKEVAQERDTHCSTCFRLFSCYLRIGARKAMLKKCGWAQIT